MMTDQGITMTAGDDQVLQVAVTNAAGVAYNLTGCAIAWALCKAAGVALVHKAVGSGITITNAAAGIFQVAIAAADTSGWDGGLYYHEARLTDAGGKSQVVMTGIVTVTSTALG